MNKGDSTMLFWWCIGDVLLENTLAFMVWNHLDGMKCWCNGAAIFCMIKPCSLWSCSGQTIGVRWNYGLWFACWWTIWTMSTTYVCNVLRFACWWMNNLRILYFWTTIIHPSLTHSFIDSSIQIQWHTHTYIGPYFFIIAYKARKMATKTSFSIHLSCCITLSCTTPPPTWPPS